MPNEEVNTMKREEFLKIQDELQKKLYWVICVDCEAFADFCIGCFYDEKEEKWKVYINYERGRRDILLVTENEEEAFDELLSTINWKIEMSSN